MLRAEQLHEKVLSRMDFMREPSDEELLEIIHSVLEESSKKQFIPLKEKAALGKELFNAFRKLDILQELIEDESITEIMINGTENIFIEREGQIFLSDKKFLSRGKLEDVVQQMVAECNRIVNEASPIVDARLNDGSRVNVVLPPAAINGPIVTIRKFPKHRITMEQLLEYESISEEAAEFLVRLVRAGYNIFISGGTGSGKTTFLNVLSDYIPETERIITIEDNAELQITELPNLVRLEARNANVEGTGEISIRDLIRTALRMRPDRIIVGEVRGKEAADMLQAFNTGHDGSLSTGHANSPKDMLSRLEMMTLMGMDIPLSAVQRQIAAGIDIMVHLGRLRDRSRKVLEIVEVLGYEKDEIRLQSLFSFRETGEKNGKIQGEWVKNADLLRREKLLAAGY
ncbi:CpaF family protein [bacterium]|uniref:CpaF family protein n=1 Tax=Lachnospiraceae TaxID=186803 RepID=UPI002A7BA6AC|nr:CpaF family protein [bacterium]MDY2885969.1 CpaF family protein [Bariatricus sp.]MCI7150543.1 CpaF family protein [bacterium]MDD7143152.1 CpaF family protein [bacterium]MDY4194310.1 CpaF family protein [Bariatricus sp.]